MQNDELLFFDGFMPLLPLYEALRQEILSCHPDTAIKVSKTQISFKNRHIFSMVSLPVRRRKGWPKQCIIVSFGLPYSVCSPRIAAASEPYPKRFTHHVIVEKESDIDGELLSWIDEAYAFSAVK